MSSKRYVARHRAVVEHKMAAKALRVAVPTATVAAVLFGTAIAASANPVPVHWGDTFSGLVQSQCGTTDWQDVAFPGRDKNKIYAGETIDINCSSPHAQVADVYRPLHKITPPPAPSKPKTTSVTTSCVGWSKTMHYWDAAQWNNARIIVSVGQKMGFGRNGLIVALMAAMQESSLYNLNYGDRDSQGLFQQRPSQGWGTVAEVTNPYYAAGKFFSALKGVSGWQNMEKTWAVQYVQRSAFPYAYAQWETDATEMVNAIVCG